jgi:ADP-ribosyl-[dinitrogen reductase] hydrolase
MLDKIKGGLFGLAIGDALGATTEFMNTTEIQKK